MSRTYCENCGEPCYNGYCTNCNEAHYIERQYMENNDYIPDVIYEEARKDDLEAQKRNCKQ